MMDPAKIKQLEQMILKICEPQYKPFFGFLFLQQLCPVCDRAFRDLSESLEIEVDAFTRALSAHHLFQTSEKAVVSLDRPYSFALFTGFFQKFHRAMNKNIATFLDCVQRGESVPVYGLLIEASLICTGRIALNHDVRGIIQESWGHHFGYVPLLAAFDQKKHRHQYYHAIARSLVELQKHDLLPDLSGFSATLQQVFAGDLRQTTDLIEGFLTHHTGTLHQTQISYLLALQSNIEHACRSVRQDAPDLLAKLRAYQLEAHEFLTLHQKGGS